MEICQPVGNGQGVLLPKPQKQRLRPKRREMSDPLPTLEELHMLGEVIEFSDSEGWAPEKKLEIFQRIRIAHTILVN